jgi:hypothetical protein
LASAGVARRSRWDAGAPETGAGMMLDGKAVTDRSREPVGVESSCCNLPCFDCGENVQTMDTCGRLGREQSSWVIGKVKSMGK